LRHVQVVLWSLALLWAAIAPAEETEVSFFVQEPETTPNLVANPGFEDGFDGWAPSSREQVSLAPGIRLDGQMSAHLCRLGEEPVPHLACEIQVVPGKLYEFGLFYRTERLKVAPDAPFNGILVELSYKAVSLRRRPLGVLRVPSGKQSSNWVEVRRQFLVPDSRKKLKVTISAPCLSGDVWVDNVYLRQCVVPKAEKRLFVKHGDTSFVEVDLGQEARNLPEFTEPQRETGFVPFVVNDPDTCRRSLLPSAEDVRLPLEFHACPGEHEPAVFAVRTLKPLTNLRCSVSDLTSGSGSVVPSRLLDLRLVQFRLRLTDHQFRDRTFRTVPELLGPFLTVDLPANTTQPFWLTAHVPADAVPGEYRGKIVLEADGQRTAELPVHLLVRPFRLAEPTDRVWALYVDSWRWPKRYPEDGALLQELKDVRSHGIRSLVLAASRDFTVQDGRETEWNDPLLARSIPLMEQAGNDGPLVLGLGFLAELVPGGKVRGPSGDSPDWSDFSWPPELQGRYVDALRLVQRRFEANRWPPFLFLGSEAVTDDRKASSRVRWEYQLAQRAGLKSLLLSSPELARTELAEAADIRCFDASLAVESGEHAAARFAECRAAGDQFWWRGAGSFNLHEGNMVRNRYLAGFLHYKSAADGCLIWTFQRPRGSAFNDFDGITTHPESAKDCCLTYPSSELAENIPTPQWEGIREGIDDYCYAHTLESALRTKLASENAADKARAEAIQKRFQELLMELPWAGERPFEGRITVPSLNAIRTQIAKWIEEVLVAKGVK
jgi:hypothetical protein